MMSTKSNELITELMSALNGDEQLFCEKIIGFMTELGYMPRNARVKSGFVLDFVNKDFNRKIAKIGVRCDKKQMNFSFALRFSAAQSYSQKFQDAVRRKNTTENAIKEYNNSLLSCSTCGICKGNSRLYTYEYPNGGKITSCGAYALQIDGVTMNDVKEIKRLIIEQHNYFKEALGKG